MSSNEQQPELMTGESLDVTEQRREEIERIFPGVYTETTNVNGDVVRAIDFERLKAELGTFSDIYEGRRERYGMEWPGKRDCMRLIQEPSRATLKPVRDESIKFDTTENLFIEGDNLEVLKLLQKSYYGKVKLIYIDPPYNTGNEFIYPDKFSESLDTYLAYSGLVDDEGKKFSTNNATEGRFHTKWLNMMYPRLYLAKNLLRDDGVIFISIDDNEVENLRRLCDEIFGEENFKANISWQKRYTRSNNTVDFTTMVEHIIVYAKSSDFEVNLLPRSEEADARYSNPDNDPRGPWKGASFLNPASPQQRPNLCYPITNPNTGQVTEPTTNAWRRSKGEFERLQAEGRLYWGRDGAQPIPSIKMFLSDARGLTPTNFWPHEYAGNTDDGTRDLDRLIPGKVFDNPKPVELIARVIEHACSDNDIVLDFFSGSSVTAEAVLRKNFSDNLHNTFINVQLQEICSEDSNAFKQGFRNIADIGKERIRRVIAEMVNGEEEDSSEEVEHQDLGFKVFRLDQSNFKQWQAIGQELDVDEIGQQLELHADNVEENAGQEDILYELLIKAGFKPTEKVETLNLAGNNVFSIAKGALLVCLEDEISIELIDAAVDMKPMQFICLDKAFKGNDQLKANAVQTFKSRSQNAETEMVFKVV